MNEHADKIPAPTAAPPARPANAVGFLRLVLASLVIVSHVPQIIDGNPSRDPLYWLTGTMGLGGAAVSGFFVISGYLIAASFQNQPTIRAYLARRIARIYPAFLIASLFCVVVAAPIGGVSWAAIAAAVPDLLERAFWLNGPEIRGAYAGTHYASINGSMWTIAHEFRCYLLVIVLGVIGAFRWRASVPLLAVLLFAGNAILAGHIAWPEARAWIVWAVPVAGPANALRLTAVFLVGTTFYLYRDRIAFKPWIALLAFAVLVPQLCQPALADPAFALLGGYVLLTIAFCVQHGPLIRINAKTDISYGVYLYAWPVAKILLAIWPAMPLAPCIALDFAIACALGWVSWHLIEKRAMTVFSRKRAPAPTA
jgi:peptidoglycan/LPS O-acetylase OafA/YrhL